jgi:hypothetical protein
MYIAPNEKAHFSELIMFCSFPPVSEVPIALESSFGSRSFGMGDKNEILGWSALERYMTMGDLGGVNPFFERYQTLIGKVFPYAGQTGRVVAVSKWRAVRDDYLEDVDREFFVQDDEMKFKRQTRRVCKWGTGAMEFRARYEE